MTNKQIETVVLSVCITFLYALLIAAFCLVPQFAKAQQTEDASTAPPAPIVIEYGADVPEPSPDDISEETYVSENPNKNKPSWWPLSSPDTIELPFIFFK